jgi:hypothetical protein
MLSASIRASSVGDGGAAATSAVTSCCSGAASGCSTSEACTVGEPQ